MIITDRLAIEKMAVDMFMYPQKFGWHFDHNDLRTIRKYGRFCCAYSEMLYHISKESVNNCLKEIIRLAPPDTQTCLLYYVIHPTSTFSDELCGNLLKWCWMTRDLLPEDSEFFTAIILSDFVSETQVQMNALFTRLESRNAEEDKYIAREIEKYSYQYILKTCLESDRKYLVEDNKDNPAIPY